MYLKCVVVFRIILELLWVKVFIHHSSLLYPFSPSALLLLAGWHWISLRLRLFPHNDFSVTLQFATYELWHCKMPVSYMKTVIWGSGWGGGHCFVSRNVSCSGTPWSSGWMHSKEEIKLLMVEKKNWMKNIFSSWRNFILKKYFVLKIWKYRIENQ